MNIELFTLLRKCLSLDHLQIKLFLLFNDDAKIFFFKILGHFNWPEKNFNSFIFHLYGHCSKICVDSVVGMTIEIQEKCIVCRFNVYIIQNLLGHFTCSR